jgi:hypothetical protein
MKYIFIINIIVIIKQYEGWGHRGEWNSEVGHEQKKVEDQCSRGTNLLSRTVDLHELSWLQLSVIFFSHSIPLLRFYLETNTYLIPL